MEWRRLKRHGWDYCFLVPNRGETERRIVSAVATASFNSAWPEGYGWEQWDPTVEVRTETVRRVLPAVFRRMPRRGLIGPPRDVLCMDYVRGRRCKTHIVWETRGEHHGTLMLDAGTFEATRGDVERLLTAAQALLAARAVKSA